MINGTTVPTGRDDTYSLSEVHRKDSDELRDSAFNSDQQNVLNEQYSSQGGGGSTPLIVNASTEDNFEWVCDKTYGEIDDAVRSGVAVVVIYERITEGWEVYTAGTVLGTQDSLNNSVWRGNVSVCGDPYDASLIALFRVQGASRDALRDEYPTFSTGD